MTSSLVQPSTVLGSIYLPATPGTPVGRFSFIVDPSLGIHVEIGTPVAADTSEGVVIGTVVDMVTVGTAKDPVGVDLGGSYELDAIATVPEVMVASVQVFHSPSMRPVRAGVVRTATHEEMKIATGFHKMEWPIPAGVIPMLDGGFAPISLDGHSLLGPDAGHMVISGLSGLASKTSFAGVLLASSLNAGSPEQDSVAAIIINVKGEDLIYLDQPPTAGYELSDHDVAMYAALGIPATPFTDVTVWAPSLPGGLGTHSPRPDACALRWDLTMIWDALDWFYPWLHDADNMMNFLADFRDEFIDTKNPTKRIDSFTALETWFNATLAEAAETSSSVAYRNHHVATVRRASKILMSLVTRCGGLVTRNGPSKSADIPTTGWHHGQVVVVDIAGLPTDVQGVVIARICQRLLRSAEDGQLGVDHLIVFADELNTFAPATGGDSSMGPVKRVLGNISKAGRYAGVSLWGAAQMSSKIDDLVRGNLGTKAVGMSADAELASGAYGKLSSGLAERLATLPRGQMALWHYSFRSALVVHFPRPAWRTGKARVSVAQRTKPKITNVLSMREESLDRLTEGLSPQIVDAIISAADDPAAARSALEAARIPDMRRQMLHVRSEVDPEDPFDLG